jgi:hypothetical protein
MSDRRSKNEYSVATLSFHVARIERRNLGVEPPGSHEHEPARDLSVLVLLPLLQQVGDDALHLHLNVRVEVRRSAPVGEDVLPRPRWYRHSEPARDLHAHAREDHLVLGIPAADRRQIYRLFLVTNWT